MSTIGILAVGFSIPIFVTLTSAAALIYMLGKIVDRKSAAVDTTPPTAE